VSDDPQAVRRVGRYEIAGTLATGGMAEVLLGRLVGPSGFERVVVIKRILRHLADQASFVDMFLDEARIAGGLHHPNVVQVHELGREGSDLYLAMEYVEGESGGSLMRRLSAAHRPLDYGLAAHIVAEACAGLHAAHELCDGDGNLLGVVHRDVSPQNIVITYGGSVKILDFGIARARDRITQTEAGQIKGKYAYMSPEQARGKPLDGGSDIFALGIVLYELSTGMVLFKRDSAMATLGAVCQAAVPLPSAVRAGYPPELEAICLRALEKRRRDRYTSAAEMRRDLAAWLRRTGPSVDPGEALGALMNELFADRAEEKRVMLRQVRRGAALSHVPPAETDGAVELPTVAGSEPAEGTNATVHTDADPSAGHQRRHPLLLAVPALLLGTALLYFTMRHSTPASSPAAPTLGETAATAQAVASGPVATIAPAASASEVEWELRTTPPGARVSVGGRAHGLTPTALSIPKQPESVEIVLELEGYEPVRESTAPSSDRSFTWDLVPKVARGYSRPSNAVPAPSQLRVQEVSSAPPRPNWDDVTAR
jgi:eukaryotic-like serine/threonine-protein kinase